MIACARVVTILALFLSILGCAGGMPPKPDWATAPDADIPAFSTFGWVDPADDRPLGVVDAQVHNVLRAEFLKKGYVEAPDAPDFVVSYKTVAYQSTQSSNPVSIGIGVGSWGGHVGGSVGTSVPVGGEGDLRDQSRVTIRAVDPKRNSEVWIGTTTAFEQPPDASAVERAVIGVMKGFPAKRK